MSEGISGNPSQRDASIDVTIASKNDPNLPAQQAVPGTSNVIEKTTEANKAEGYEDLKFPCEKCGKEYSKKKALDLHMTGAHNTKTITYTPGPVPCKSKMETKTRLSLKCDLCTFICKSNPSMNRHQETQHKTNTAQEQPEVKKRQMKSFTCPSCNSTFVSNYRMRNHIKEQHEGKNILSPERKIARTDDKEEEVKNVEDGTITIPREHMENLQDILLQTGKDKEDLEIKLAEGKRRMDNLEKENSKLEQENMYFKAENKKSYENITKIDMEYQKQILDMKKNDEEKNNVIKILKDQLVRQGAVPSISGPGGISSPKPPLAAAVAAPTPTAASPAVSPVADLETSLVNLAVTQNIAPNTPQDINMETPLDYPQTAPGDIAQPAPQDSSQTTLQGETREATENTVGEQLGDPTVQVDECVKNFRCQGNCEHIGCHIKKCEECSFQTDNERRLESHIRETHRITCFTCQDTFKTFSEMIEHRRLNHPSTKICSNFPNCERGDRCLYRHEGVINNVGTPDNQTQAPAGHITCRICLSEFYDKNEMMVHRKSDHLDKVGMCKNIEAGLKCRKGPMHCWYRHDRVIRTETTSRNNTEAPAFTVQNFPFRPTPQGGVVGQNQMQLQMIQQTLQAQQQQMSMMMTEIMRMRQ